MKQDLGFYLKRISETLEKLNAAEREKLAESSRRIEKLSGYVRDLQ